MPSVKDTRDPVYVCDVCSKRGARGMRIWHNCGLVFESCWNLVHYARVVGDYVFHSLGCPAGGSRSGFDANFRRSLGTAPESRVKKEDE